MTWEIKDQQRIARAILGSWPTSATTMGKAGIAAYVGELEARGLAFERALAAIRSWPAGSDFPPSAPNLAAVARRDPSTPTFSEMVVLVFGAGGVLSARTKDPRSSWGLGERVEADRKAMLERAGEMHPLLMSFIAREGIDYLRGLNLDDEQFGGARRAKLQERWVEHLSVMEERDVAALTAPRRDGLRRLDPLAPLGVDRRALGAGHDRD